MPQPRPFLLFRKWLGGSRPVPSDDPTSEQTRESTEKDAEQVDGDDTDAASRADLVQEGRDFGPSRVVTRLTAEGYVEYRPDEVLLDVLTVLGRDEDEDVELSEKDVVAAVERVRDSLSEEGRESLIADRESFGKLTTGFARLSLRGADALDFVRRENANFEEGREPFSINTVFRISGLTADPFKFAGSLSADPFKFAAALGLDPFKFANSSSARPTGPPEHFLDPVAFDDASAPVATVAIVDTGKAVEQNTEIDETPDENGDGWLDLAAGHAMFIKHIVQRAQPSVDFWFEGVMENDGDGDDQHLAAALDNIRTSIDDHEHLIVNLSLSGYYPGDVCPPAIRRAINRLLRRRALVVAAAGNDGDCRPKFPAALAGVVSVGALSACGPADFSNHGHWVDASAPGEDVVSCFFDGFQGAFEPPPGSLLPDIDDFDGWAMWSGTSFSTPVVVGTIAQTMRIYGCTARRAAEIVLRRPGLFRVPDYGVVVNRVF